MNQNSHLPWLQRDGLMTDFTFSKVEEGEVKEKATNTLLSS